MITVTPTMILVIIGLYGLSLILTKFVEFAFVYYRKYSIDSVEKIIVWPLLFGVLVVTVSLVLLVVNLIGG